MKRRGLGRLLWLVGSVLVVAALVTGSLLYIHRGPAPITHIRISGTVIGDSAAGRKAGHIQHIDVAAHITCNAVTATAAADGSFSLVVPIAKIYACQTAAPLYLPQSITLTDLKKVPLTLSFTNTLSYSICATQGVATTCPELQLLNGSLTGNLTKHGKIVASSIITCNDLLTASSYTAVTNSSGHFTIVSLLPDQYFCSAYLSDGSGAAHQTYVGPGTVSSLNLSTCPRACPGVGYLGGPVIHAMDAYLIFWLPKGYVMDPAMSDSRYESLMERYFQSVGGSHFYGILMQYWDQQGFIQNTVKLGGMYTDTTPYEHCGAGSINCKHAAASIGDPIVTNDIQVEISRAMQAKGWKNDPNSVFFVFVGDGAQLCYVNHDSCSYPIKNFVTCGLHSNFQDALGSPLVYAQIADTLTSSDPCVRSFSGSGTAPQGDWAFDSEASIVSHEQFESATDPVFNAWGTSDGQEIGDLCEADFSSFRDVTLNFGNTYFIQSEWSNAAGRCAYS